MAYTRELAEEAGKLEGNQVTFPFSIYCERAIQSNMDTLIVSFNLRKILLIGYLPRNRFPW